MGILPIPSERLYQQWSRNLYGQGKERPKDGTQNNLQERRLPVLKFHQVIHMLIWRATGYIKRKTLASPPIIDLPEYRRSHQIMIEPQGAPTAEIAYELFAWY
jgi:hypothetical protein